MSTKRTVLVTGAAGYWGARTAARLAAQSNLRVIGLDLNSPSAGLEGVHFIQADIRSRKLADLLEAERVDVVCHLGIQASPPQIEDAFEANVTGTTRVLDACVQSGVRQVVLKSTTAVYGARPENPAFIKEEHHLLADQVSAWLHDQIEIESFYSGYRRQSPDLSQCILRFANIVGPSADTPLTRYLSTRWVVTLLGFDPMMQIIHEEDVVNALVHAILNEASGIYNVAAEDSLPLNKLIGLAGKLPAPMFHYLVYRRGPGMRSATKRHRNLLPFDPDYIRYPWVGDLTKMRDELGFTPQHRADEALREFAKTKEDMRAETQSSPDPEVENHG